MPVGGRVGTATGVSFEAEDESEGTGASLALALAAGPSSPGEGRRGVTDSWAKSLAAD